MKTNTLTSAGFTILTIAAKDPRGRASGPCHGLATSGPRLKLRTAGFLLAQPFGPDLISPAGREAIGDNQQEET